MALVRDIRNLISGLLLGIGFTSWMMLFHFDEIWLKSSPHTPDSASGAIYAHVEHGGLSYYTAIQSVVSHLFFPVWFLMPLGILLSVKKNVQTRFLGVRWENDDPHHTGIVGGALGVIGILAAVYFFGHQIIEQFIAWGLAPSSDSLDLVDHT